MQNEFELLANGNLQSVVLENNALAIAARLYSTGETTFYVVLAIRPFGAFQRYATFIVSDGGMIAEGYYFHDMSPAANDFEGRAWQPLQSSQSA